MPTIDIRRHGRDILITYRTLTQLAGHTLTDRHLDRLADRALPNSSLRDVLAAALDQLLTPAESHQVHEELIDPFAGQAPPRVPAPCDSRDAAVLAALRALQIEHDAEPFLVDDSDAATERDLAYFDRLIEILDLGDDEPPAPTPQYQPDQYALYRDVITAVRPHTTLDSAAFTAIHSLVTALTDTATDAAAEDAASTVAAPDGSRCRPERGR